MSRTSSLGELLATVASEASQNPFVGSDVQKEAWDEIKRRFAALEEALAMAVSELERVSQRDMNHDGFGAEPVEPEDCRLCQAIQKAKEALGYGDDRT